VIFTAQLKLRQALAVAHARSKIHPLLLGRSIHFLYKQPSSSVRIQSENTKNTRNNGVLKLGTQVALAVRRHRGIFNYLQLQLFTLGGIIYAEIYR
jgi:hypothetical protein